MNDLERMQAGLAHQPYHPDMSAVRLKIKEMLFDYNNVLRPSQKAERTALIKQIIGRTKNNIKVNPPFFCDYGFQIEVGENFFANYGCTMLDSGGIQIGDNVMFGPNVSLYSVEHPLHPELRNAEWEHGGVTIGDNVVIGAGAVVTKDIPANSLAVGNPCRVLRDITDADREFYCRTYLQNV